MFVGKR